MRNYFRRLKEHPGVPFATFLTVLGTLAGASNENFENPVDGALFGLIVMFVCTWVPVLITNFKK